MSESTRLDWLKKEHTNRHTTCSCKWCEDVGYLLNLVDILGKQIEAQILAHLDPTPTCSCWHEIIDDAGSTIVGEYDPTCTIHGKEYADD